ncbi:MAG: hypothetical protein ACTHMS_13785 [Jatrophihabitans sp.]|uniref:hypothetical protein n=1 Tax=Jatrophihabitans sp. TaxID=1932789 RepID=UPI003F7F5277
MSSPEVRRSRRGRHRQAPSRRRRLIRLTAAITGTTSVFVGATAASNWVAGLNSNSSAQGQAATISNLTIAASSTSLTNLLYPGASGDAAVSVTNPNPFPVTVTGVKLPTNTTYATGYTDSGLSSAASGCDNTTSYVGWAYATGTSGTTHTLTTPFTVGANSSLTVVFTNDASMGNSAAANCAGAYFKMPSFTGVVATGGAASASSGPFTTGWTS